MFVLKSFNGQDLEMFFDIFANLGVKEIEADYMGQGELEEFNVYCWNEENEEICVTDDTECLECYTDHINNNYSCSLAKYLDSFVRSCIPLDYKDKFGSFGVIKFKMEERDYEIIKFEYTGSLDF